MRGSGVLHADGRTNVAVAQVVPRARFARDGVVEPSTGPYCRVRMVNSRVETDAVYMNDETGAVRSQISRCRGLAAVACVFLLHMTLAIGLGAQTPVPDTARVHDALRKEIAKFELVWYRTWETAQSERNEYYIRRGASTARRAAALSCYFGEPRLQGGLIRVWVSGPVDGGAVCPLWFPPDENIPPDEAEDIDLALSGVDARPARMARDALLQVLAISAELHPADVWIVGQRVRFLIDQHQFAEARTVADACRGDARACTDLRALARYVSGDLAGAEALFRESDALAAAARPADAACLPEGLIALFDDIRARQVSDASCADQERIAATLFFLADPLFALAGNERYVAHGVRRVQTALRAIDRRDERYVWVRGAAGDGLRYTVLRYGWPSHTYWAGWTQERRLGQQIEAMPQGEGFITEGFNKKPGPKSAGGGGRVFQSVSLRPIRQFFTPYTVKEYSPDRTALVPAFVALEDPFALDSSHYDLRNPDLRSPDAWWPHEHMQLNIDLRPMQTGQDIVLRRDSANRYLVAVDDPLRGHTTSAAPVQAALVGGQSEGTLRVIAESEVTLGDVLRFDGRIGGDPLVASAEVFVGVQPLSALRLRYGLRPPPVLEALPTDSVALSPPLFLRMPRGGAAVPMDPESAIGAMAGTRTFPKTVPLVFYWESYGLTPTDTVQVSVTVRRDDERSTTRVVGSSLGLVSALRDSISVRWTEPDGRHLMVVPGTRMIVGRALSLDMSTLPAGDYALSVQVEHAAKGTARSSRRFTLTERP